MMKEWRGETGWEGCPLCTERVFHALDHTIEGHRHGFGERRTVSRGGSKEATVLQYAGEWLFDGQRGARKPYPHGCSIANTRLARWRSVQLLFTLIVLLRDMAISSA